MMTGKVSKKVCLIGDFGVGKTSLVRRFVDGSFSDRYLTTVGVKIARKLVHLQFHESVNQSADRLVDRTQNQMPIQSVQLLIWDIEGSSKFKGIVPTYLQGASGAIIVADLSRPETIAHLEQHISTFLNINPKGNIVVALNKTDLVGAEAIVRVEKLVLTKTSNDEILGVYSTSAKTGAAVDEIFAKLAQVSIV